MKLATFNVNGITRRLAHLLVWLEREAPDIVCLQELKALDTAFPVNDLKRAGYGALWRGQRSWNGVAVLGKGVQPREIRRGLPGNAADEQSRYLEVEVHGLVVACLYLPNGNPQPGPKFDYKLAWFDRLIEHAATLYASPGPVALVGDFNVVPTDFDIYNPRSWKRDALLQPQSRSRYERLLAQGWTDALRAFHPSEAKLYTFWDYTAGCWQRDLGFRLDHLLCSPEAADRLEGAGVDRWARAQDKASDHAPTWIELA